MKDLNLLKVFDAIMSTGSVNGAAAKLQISAPAISQSLAKLRYEYNEPLFIRDGRGLKATSFALSLYEELEGPLSLIMNSTEVNSNFDPSISHRTFRIASNPDMDLLFFTKLRERLKIIAPNVKIEIKAEERDEEKIQDFLRLRKVDLILATIPLSEKSYMDEVISELKPCLVCRSDHPRIGNILTKDQFFIEEHCTWVSPRKQIALLKHAFKESGGNGIKIVYSSQSFLNLALMAKNSDMLAIGTTTHYNMIKDINGLKQLELPFDLDNINVYCSWHKSFNKDKGLIWLKEVLTDIFKDINNTGK